MKNGGVFGVIVLVITVMVGISAVKGNEKSPESLRVQSHDHMGIESATEHSRQGPSHNHHADGNNRHQQFAVSADDPVPVIELAVYEDSLKGWNLEVRVTHFAFAPTSVNEGSSSQNEGHAHLYIDGEKVTRLYGNWFYLGELDIGDREISVTLNTNRHEELVYEGEVLSATTTITVPDPVAMQ